MNQDTDQGTLKPECGHQDRFMTAVFLGETDDGEQKWGRKCLKCGDRKVFTYAQ